MGGHIISLLVAAGIILLLLKLAAQLLRALFALLAGLDIAGFLIRVTQPASPIAIDISHHSGFVTGILLATLGGGIATLVLPKRRPRPRYRDVGGGEPPSSYGYSPGGYSPADSPPGGDSGGSGGDTSGGGSSGGDSCGW